jgi:hypothetical protein
LKEGGAFDERLTKLAEKEVTPALLAMDGPEEDGEDSPAASRKAGSQGRASA